MERLDSTWDAQNRIPREEKLRMARTNEQGNVRRPIYFYIHRWFRRMLTNPQALGPSVVKI